MIAASHNFPAIVALLLNSGANVNAECHENEAALISTGAHHGRQEIVRLLLDYGANVNAWDRYFMPAFSWAGMNGNEDVLRMLLQLPKVDVNAT